MPDSFDPVDSSQATPPVDSVKASGKPRTLLAAVLSALVPGTGQLLLGQRRKGAILLALFAGMVICFWPLRILRFYPGILAVFWSWIAVYIYAACSAGLARHLPADVRPSKWWLALVLPMTLLAMSLIGAGITRLSGFMSFVVPSSSMEKTIREGDRLIADMNYYRSRGPGRQEVIIFKKDGIFFIKRVIATSGDSIVGKDGVVYVNGQLLDEAYVQHIGQPPEWANGFGPDVVPDGKYFVMGDNRDVSLDSRSPDFGLVPVGSVVGKPLYVFGSDRDGKALK